ncbi:fabG [Symbiodinium sp. CCMP2456]|nr:fabG [Symbiodinium sp. CCMP2456]
MVLVECQECGTTWPQEEGKNCPTCGTLSTQIRDEASDEEDYAGKTEGAMKFERRFTEGNMRKKAEDQEKIDRQRAAVAQADEDPKLRLRRLREFTSSELPLTRGAKMQFIFLQMLQLSGPILGISTDTLLHAGKILWFQYLDLLCQYEASIPAGQKRQLLPAKPGPWRRTAVPQMDAATLLALLWMALSNCLYPILFSDLTYFIRYGFLRKLGKHVEETLNPTQRCSSWYRTLPSFPPWPPEIAEAAEQLTSLGLRCTWPTVNQLLPRCSEKVLASTSWQGHQGLRRDLLSTASKMTSDLPHGAPVIAEVALCVAENLHRKPSPLRLADSRGSRPEVAAFLFSLGALVKMTRRVSRNERVPLPETRRCRKRRPKTDAGAGREGQTDTAKTDITESSQRGGAALAENAREAEPVIEFELSTEWRDVQNRNIQQQLRKLGRYREHAAAARRDKEDHALPGVRRLRRPRVVDENDSISSDTDTDLQQPLVVKEEAKEEPAEEEVRPKPGARARGTRRSQAEAARARRRRLWRVGRVLSHRRPMPIGRKCTPIGTAFRRRRRKEKRNISTRREILARFLAAKKSQIKVPQEPRSHEDWEEDRLMREKLQRTPLVLCCRHVAHCLAGEPSPESGASGAPPLKRQRDAFESLVRLLVRTARALADAVEKVEQCHHRRQNSMVHLSAAPGQPLPCSDDDDDAPRIRVVHHFTRLNGHIDTSGL